jgi:hypothetical protein
MRVTRRALLGFAGLAVFAPRPIAARASSTLELLRVHVAGLPYYDYPRLRAALPEGARLVLRRQPGNAHDRCAIEVFTEAGAKLGYVPRGQNVALASLLDAGAELEARVINAGSPTYYPLWMSTELVHVPAAFAAAAG